MGSVPRNSPPVPNEPNIRHRLSADLLARHGGMWVLPKFSGTPEEWPRFYLHYHHSTTACGYTDAENALRLRQCLQGKALDSVDYLLWNSSGVKEAIETLRTLYGQPEMIILPVLEKMRNLPAPKPDQLASLKKYGLSVRNVCRAIRGMGGVEYLYDFRLMQELVRKLPASTRLQWLQHRAQLEGIVCLQQFSEWLGELAMVITVDNDE